MKRKASRKSRGKKKKNPVVAATLAEEIAAALKVGAELPSAPTVVAGTVTVPPMIQVPQGTPPASMAKPQVVSLLLTAHSMVATATMATLQHTQAVSFVLAPLKHP